jgi:hypothetical protein
MVELGDVDLAVKTYYLLYTFFGGKHLSGGWAYSYTKPETKPFFNSLELYT